MERLYTHTLQPTLDMLDEGIRLYRRGFVLFALLTASWIVPFAVGIGMTIALEQPLFTILVLFLTIPMAIHLIASSSRVVLSVQQDTPITFWEAWKISPLRLAGMGCYMFALSIVVNTLVVILLYACACFALFLPMAFLSGAATPLDNNGGSAALGMVMGSFSIILFLLLYIVSGVVNGAVYCCVIYAVQPFVQHEMNFGQSVQRSMDMLTYRPGANIIAFLITSLIFGAVAISVVAAIGILLPLPLMYALGQESYIAQGVSASAWMIGLIAVLPLLPVWMALLYQRNYAQWAGNDLATRIELMTKERHVS